jgi:hypothetical protein
VIVSKPDLRRRAVLPLIAALALGLAACGDSKSGSSDTDPASVVPETAGAYLAVDLHPEGEAGKNAAAASQSLFDTATPGQLLLDTLAGRAKALDGLSYEEDVAPWIGDQVALAAVPVEEGKSAPLLVASTRDEDKARATLRKTGKLSESASASGVDYVRTADGSLAGAVTDGVVMVGSDAAVQLSLAAAKDGNDLTELQRYRNATGALPDGGIATAYVDLDSFAKLLSGVLGGGTTGGLLETLLTGQGDAIAATLIPEEDRLRIEAVGTATGSGIAAIQAKGGASDAIKTLPADSALALGVSDVGATLKLLLQRLGSQGGLTGIGLNLVLSRLEESTGLNLERDVLGWMGSGGLFVRSAGGHTGGGLVVESSDPAAMRRAVRRLRTALAGIQLPGVPAVSALRVPGVDEGMTLTLGNTRIQIAAADEQLVIAIGPGALADALRPGAKLGDDPKFKAASEMLGEGLKPGFYADFEKLGGGIGGLGGGATGDLLSRVTAGLTQAVGGGKQDGDTSKVEIVAGLRQP